MEFDNDPLVCKADSEEEEYGYAGIYYRDGNIKRSLVVRPQFANSDDMKNAIIAARSAEILIGYTSRPGHFFPIARNNKNADEGTFEVNTSLDPFSEEERKEFLKVVPFSLSVPDMGHMLRECSVEFGPYELFPTYSKLNNEDESGEGTLAE